MNSITILKSRGQWLARYSGPHAYAVVARYGTCEVATGCPTTYSAGSIAEFVQAANPGVCVVAGVGGV